MKTQTIFPIIGSTSWKLVGQPDRTDWNQIPAGWDIIFSTITKDFSELGNEYDENKKKRLVQKVRKLLTVVEKWMFKSELNEYFFGNTCSRRDPRQMPPTYMINIDLVFLFDHMDYTAFHW